MADQGPLDIKTNVPQKGLVTDLQENLVPEDVWTFARNAVTNSHKGQVQFLQNAPSNSFCVEFTYPVVGYIKLLNARWAIFSTDELNSEIGVFDEKDCSYTKLVNDSCLSFSANFPIRGVSKELFDCTEAIYWTDIKNPRRYLNLSNIPYKFTEADDVCKTRTYTKELDCARLQIDKNIEVPSIDVELATGGALKNGVLEFGVAYTINKERVSDFYTLTNPQSVWTHQNFGQSINLTISGLDTDFDQYELIVIYEQNQVTRYKSLGFFPIGTTSHNISDVNRAEYTELTLEEILVVRPKYPNADNVVSNDQYILWSGVKGTPELNYQLQAMSIKMEYEVYEAPADYYAKGGRNVGYLRDEGYLFAIQWLLPTGDWSSGFHIPGPKATGKEKGLASGPNVYEIDLGDKSKIEQWQVENTAGVMSSTLNGTSVIGRGLMGYSESTYLYPDNRGMFGDDSCTPIRIPKFPDNTKTHIYSNSGLTINILGIRFANVEHPKDANGKYIDGISAFRIVRADRRGNETIVSKGVFTNVRAYNEGSTEVLYPNYPYNDLRTDFLLSSKQTYNNFGERDNIPLEAFKTDQFNYYSPHSLFSHSSLGNEAVFYTEEIGTVKGAFEEVYKHPKAKLLTQFDLYFALIIGALDGYYATTGQRGKTVTILKNNTASLTLGAGVLNSPSGPVTLTPSSVLTTNNKQTTAVNDALSFISTTDVDTFSLDFAGRVLRGLAKVGVFAYFAIQTAQKVLDIIAEASPFEKYALQYNSHGYFNAHKSVDVDQRRRYIPFYQYLFDGINTVQDIKFNNYKREDSVYVRLQKEIAPPTTTDNTRNTMVDLNLCGNPFGEATTKASIFYGAIKRKYPAQYGQLDGIKYMDTGYLQKDLTNTAAVGSSDRMYTTDIVFGGDTFINRMAIRRSHHFFSFFLHDVPDGYIHDYRNYRNVAYPRYWIDSTPFDMSDVVSLNPKQSHTPRNKHNLNCEGNGGLNSVTVIKDQYFYLFYNGVLDYFCESSYNLDFRDWKLDQPNFYSRFNTDLSTIFRSDRIETREEFVYDQTYSKLLTENYIVQQRVDYDSNTDATCFQYVKNRVIYSLPAFKDQRGDNWLVYLPLNFYDFPMTDFGSLTAMHPIDNQQIMFLFDKSSPYVTIGRDELQLDGSGTKITIGDGGLFARPPRPLTYTDFYYGNCQSKWAFVNTQFGSIYPSQRQGRIFNWRGQFDEISRNGMHWWFKNYLPSFIATDFPNYKHLDNPALGVALISGFDANDEVYYLTKRDYKLRDGYKGLVTYDETKDKFVFNLAGAVKLTDQNYFEDASWTISYSARDRTFVSWHDWHPEWMLQGERHFMTIKGKALWKHNETCLSFCNYYGANYPFEVEYLVNNGQNVEILKSIEYQLDIGKYYTDCRDFHSVLDDNFDYVVIHNTEQCSGIRRMILQSKKDMSQLMGYPAYNTSLEVIDVLYAKEEQKHRVNQFTDIIKDRGEFTKYNFPMWLSSANGYIRTLNLVALNYQKPIQLQKKFRATWHKVLLTKNVSGDKKYIVKFLNSKQSNSYR